METPNITVITVVRNDISHIESTIKSVIGQTYKNIEYIVIDGGSTDGTVDIIKKYSDHISYWISEPDGGIYPAMNKGLLKAKGEWVNFMNSGDSFYDENVISDIFELKVSEYTDGLKAWPDTIKVIGGHTNRIYSDHTEMHHYWDPRTTHHFMPFGHQACFTRRLIDSNDAQSYQFDSKYRYAADYAIMVDIFWKYGPQALKALDRPIANYSMEGSPSFVNAKKVKREFLAIQSRHIDWRWIKEYIKWRWL